MNDHGLRVGIEDGADEGVLEGADLDDLVDERVLRATQTLQLVAAPLPLTRIGRSHHEHFEVRLVGLSGLGVRR